MPKLRARTKDGRLTVRVRLSSGEKLNEGSFETFARIYVRGLMKAERIQRLTFRGIEYSGPAGVSLEERLQKPMKKYDFYLIVEQIVDIVRRIYAASLSIGAVIWNPGGVFINETTREMQFIYLPLEPDSEDLAREEHFQDGPLELIRSVIYQAAFADEDTEFVTRFTYFLNGMKLFDTTLVEEYIRKEDRSIVNMVRHKSGSPSGFITDKQKDFLEHYEDEEGTLPLDDDEDGTMPLDAEEATGILTENDAGYPDPSEEGTMLLQDEEYAAGASNREDIHYPTLLRVLTNETTKINKPVFRIGKERSYADLFVSDNPAVSRSHADIITREHRYYVMDLNSKNRTFLNGNVVSPMEETPIRDGDHLVLGNEEFIFHE